MRCSVYLLVLGMFLRRLVTAVGMALLIVLITTALSRNLPGDACSALLADRASRETYAQCLRDQPSPFARFLYTFKRLGRGDLGISLRTGQPVLGEIRAQLPDTLKLAGMTLLLALPLGVAGGLWAAHLSTHWIGRALNWAAVALVAMPGFLLIFLLIAVLVSWLGLLPLLDGATTFKGMLLPLLALGLPNAALALRVMRGITIRELRRDYVRTARAKGLSQEIVLFRHVLRNLMPAMIGLANIMFLELLDGAILIEAMFSRPGLGRYTANAMRRHDYPALQGVVLVITVLTLGVNIAADSLRVWFIPQKRD
jgi:peptide/nickel transport system permease protein